MKENSKLPAYGSDYYEGLSKREYFAIELMRAIVTSGTGVEMPGKPDASYDPSDIALVAVRGADALLKQLKDGK